jgi:PAS domain S-box-containing protein
MQEQQDKNSLTAGNHDHPPEESGLGKGDILIVDDVPINLRLLTQMLTKQGYKVRPVTSGAQALVAAQSTPPDLILLDVMMPGMNGYEVCERLKADERTSNIPIIFVSALKEAESKLKGFTAGGVDYVTKPFWAEEVLARVETHLTLRTVQQRLEEQNAQLEREIAERARVEEELRQRNRELTTLYDASTIMTSNLSLDAVLQNVVRQITQALDSSACTLLFWRRERDQVETLVDYSEVWPKDKLDPPGSTYDLDEYPLMRQVLETSQPAIIQFDDPTDDEAEATSMRDQEVRTLFMLPMTIQEQTVGLVELTEKTQRREYTLEEIRLAQSLAAQAAVAIKNAQLFEEVKQQEERFRSVTQSANDAIISADGDENIISWNKAAQTMFGYQEREVLGQPLIRLIPEQNKETYRKGMRRLHSTGQVRPSNPAIETEMLRKDDSKFPVELSLSSWKTDEETFYSAIVRDITTRKQAEEAQRQYAANLEAQNAELDAFAHTVAHDLKNPLTSLIASSMLLEARHASMSEERLRSYTHTIAQSGHTMNNIIDELLLLSSVREMDEIDTRELDMKEIVNMVENRLAYSTEEYEAEVIVPDEWPVAIGYSPWVEEVWINYITNAFKYGGQPPRAELGADVLETETPEADDLAGKVRKKMVRFWVRDNGHGLTPREQERLFTPFERLHQVRVEGHGLGLSIVRRIVEKLGGEVGVESTVGQGSVFYFTLPARVEIEQRDG